MIPFRDLIEKLPVCLERSNLVYPDSAMNTGIAGEVYVVILLDSIKVIV